MEFFPFIDQSDSFNSDRLTNTARTDYFKVIIFRKKRFVKNESFTNLWFVG